MKLTLFWKIKKKEFINKYMKKDNEENINEIHILYVADKGSGQSIE